MLLQGQNMHIKHVMVILIASTVVVTFGKECEEAPTCSCRFGGDKVPVEENTTGREIMAGTVGAVGGLVVAGGTAGLLYLLKGRKTLGTSKYGRAVSDVSEDSVSSSGRGEQNGKTRPPPYRKPHTEYRAGGDGAKPQIPNIYKVGLHDNINPRVSIK